MSTSLQT